jgi:hypothetical protein
MTQLQFQPWLNLQLIGMGLALIILVHDVVRHPGSFKARSSDSCWFALMVFVWWGVLILLLVDSGAKVWEKLQRQLTKEGGQN